MNTDSEHSDLPAVELIRELDAATTLLKPPRPALLAALRQPDSASGLARRLGLPRQRLNHHLRELERIGFVELVEERRRGNFTERILRATARHYLLSPELLGELGAVHPAEILRLGTLGWLPLALTASQTIRDLAILRDALGDQVPALLLPAQVRFSEPTAFNDFVAELTTEIARLCAKYNDETVSTARHRFFVAAYPEVPPRPQG